MKLIGIDLDGTLLNSKHEISKKNIEALNSIINKDGYYLYICSGRSEQNIKHILDKYGLNITRVGTNGGVAYDGEINLYEYAFTENQAFKVYEVIKDFPFITYNKFGGFSDRDHLEKLNFIKSLDINISDEKSFSSEIYDSTLAFNKSINFYDTFKNNNQKIFKFFIYMPDIENKKIIQNRIKNLEGVSYTESDISNIEIIPSHVNKGKVFELLEKHLGIEKSTRIAIGDSLNDLEMFQKADYSFAMDNANPKIKDLATHVVSSNDEDGVAEAIEIIENL